MRRKLSCLLICCLLIVACVFPAPASAEDLAGRSASMTVNEYELLSDLQNESNSALAAKGYTYEQIDSIHNLKESYAAHLEQFTDLSDSALKNLGYSDEQIAIFREFNGSETQIQALAADLNIDLTADYVTWSSADNRTNAMGAVQTIIPFPQIMLQIMDRRPLAADSNLR